MILGEYRRRDRIEMVLESALGRIRRDKVVKQGNEDC